MGRSKSRGRGGRSRAEPDSWSRKARAQGYEARSVFKLEELQRRFRLLAPGARVLDLGCAPGSWLRYAAEQVGPKGSVVGIDRVESQAPAPHVCTLVGDVYETPMEALDSEGLGFDLVMSDMAPDTTGMASTDQARSAALAERALELAEALLKPGGAFVAKVFQGPDVQGLLGRARRGFTKAKLARPAAIRKQSSEIYLVATGWQPVSPAAAADGEEGG